MRVIDFRYLKTIGTPLVDKENAAFNGSEDGLFLRELPLPPEDSGLKVSLDFFPESGGLTEQRFFHLGHPGSAKENGRLMIELRSLEKNRWCLDLYYSDGETGKALLDYELTHPNDRWYTIVVILDHRGFRALVNGKEELAWEGLSYVPFLKKDLSLGVRQNRTSWYKGKIRNLIIGVSDE